MQINTIQNLVTISEVIMPVLLLIIFFCVANEHLSRLKIVQMFLLIGGVGVGLGIVYPIVSGIIFAMALSILSSLAGHRLGTGQEGMMDGLMMILTVPINLILTLVLGGIQVMQRKNS